MRIVSGSRAEILAFSLDVRVEDEGDSYSFPTNCDTRLAVLQSGEAIGGCSRERMSAEVLVLCELFVLSAYRGEGYGRLLALDTLRIARMEGYRRVRLYAAPNAVEFYRSIGFIFQDSITCYYELGKGLPS